jgi:hypothetical protein
MLSPGWARSSWAGCIDSAMLTRVYSGVCFAQSDAHVMGDNLGGDSEERRYMLCSGDLPLRCAISANMDASCGVHDMDTDAAACFLETDRGKPDRVREDDFRGPSTPPCKSAVWQRTPVKASITRTLESIKVKHMLAKKKRPSAPCYTLLRTSLLSTFESCC